MNYKDMNEKEILTKFSHWYIVKFGIQITQDEINEYLTKKK